MPDKNLTDKEIVKALECCINNLCPNCPLGHHITGTYNEHCGDDLMKNALNLINRLQEKDETRHKVFETKCEELEIAKAENERLKGIKTTDWLVKGISKEQLEKEKIEAIHENAYKLGKAEAYKEFAERLKDYKQLYEDLKAEHLETIKLINKGIKTAKTEAYKEAFEKVKEKSNKMELVCSGALVRTDYTITEDALDNLLKEMVGE